MGKKVDRKGRILAWTARTGPMTGINPRAAIRAYDGPLQRFRISSERKEKQT